MSSSRGGDAVFDRWARKGLDHYDGSGIVAELLSVKVREDAYRQDIVARAEAASMIYFTGGKPNLLADVLRDSPLLAAVRRAMERGAVYAGCSAGAIVASREHNAEGRVGTSWLFGLGLVPNVSFGVHWDRWSQVPGTQWWMTSRLPDDTWFVGIDERTALYGDGTNWEVAGLGTASVRGPGVSAIYEPGDRFVTPSSAGATSQ